MMGEVGEGMVIIFDLTSVGNVDSYLLQKLYTVMTVILFIILHHKEIGFQLGSTEQANSPETSPKIQVDFLAAWPRA